MISKVLTTKFDPYNSEFDFQWEVAGVVLSGKLSEEFLSDSVGDPVTEDKAKTFFERNKGDICKALSAMAAANPTVDNEAAKALRDAGASSYINRDFERVSLVSASLPKPESNSSSKKPMPWG